MDGQKIINMLGNNDKNVEKMQKLTIKLDILFATQYIVNATSDLIELNFLAIFEDNVRLTKRMNFH